MVFFLSKKCEFISLFNYDNTDHEHTKPSFLVNPNREIILDEDGRKKKQIHFDLIKCSRFFGDRIALVNLIFFKVNFFFTQFQN